MHKTMIYLPDDLRRAVSMTARRRGISKAALIRDAIATAVLEDRPAPRAGLFSSDVLMARTLTTTSPASASDDH